MVFVQSTITTLFIPPYFCLIICFTLFFSHYCSVMFCSFHCCFNLQIVDHVRAVLGLHPCHMTLCTQRTPVASRESSSRVFRAIRMPCALAFINSGGIQTWAHVQNPGTCWFTLKSGFIKTRGPAIETSARLGLIWDDVIVNLKLILQKILVMRQVR